MNCIGNDQVRIGLGKCYVNAKVKKCNRHNIKTMVINTQEV